MRESLERAQRALGEADALLICAGAGMGVDSGLPDFRGDEGFWNAYPPIRKLGYSFVEMANPRWFEEDPELAWGFYGHRLNLYRSTVPHEGFSILLEAAKRKSCFVFTSNVDGQFQKAGFGEERILECHGSIHHLQCTRNCSDDSWISTGVEVEVDEETFRAQGGLPRCEHCDALARPNILMFGDWGWNPSRTESQERRFARWIESLQTQKAKLAVIEIGAGEAVPTVRRTSERIARALDATLVRINPRDHDVPAGQIGLEMGGREGIRAVLQP